MSMFRASHDEEHRRSLEKLKKYLSDHLRRGANVNVLRKTVLDSGWPVEVIEQAFREIGY